MRAMLRAKAAEALRQDEALMLRLGVWLAAPFRWLADRLDPPPT